MLNKPKAQETQNYTSESKSHSVMSNSLLPHGLQSMEFTRPKYWSEQPFPSPGDLPNPWIKPRPPVIAGDSLQAEPQGKPKNTGVGSLSVLQQIFPTQESNWGLLHYRWILYQLSYHGSPIIDNSIRKTNEVQLLIRPKEGAKRSVEKINYKVMLVD